MARIQTWMAQDAIWLQIPRLSQTNRWAVVQMQRLMTETGLTSRSASGWAKKLRQCDPAMPYSLRVWVSAAVAWVWVWGWGQEVSLSVPMTIRTHCSADSRKALLLQWPLAYFNGGRGCDGGRPALSIHGLLHKNWIWWWLGC
jgi:hypothetical protein